MKQEAVAKKLVRRTSDLIIGPSGHCSGCHYGIIQGVIAEALEELDIADRAIMVVGVGCSSLWPMQWDLDTGGCLHGRPCAAATAIKRVRPDAVVFTVQGDGDLLSIGMSHFIHAMYRGEQFTTIFLNNAGYGMTGGQMAPTTMLGMRTTTTPTGRDYRTAGFPVYAAELAATIPGTAYAARVSVHTPANRHRAKKALVTAFQKQLDGVGYGIVEFLSACPTIWGMSPTEALEFIEKKWIPVFPLGEFKNVDSLETSASG